MEMTTGLLIRRPPAEVFRAFADPTVTTRFWFTKSSGPLEPGAKVSWEWEMYGVGTDVTVREIVPGERIVIEWDQSNPSTVEWRFTPAADGTYVQIREHGMSGTAEEVAARVVDSTKGFTFVLAGAKAWLEHGIELNLVADAKVDHLSGRLSTSFNQDDLHTRPPR
jgi:uncharacterized protein YndB with AHSA1/START domain